MNLNSVFVAVEDVCCGRVSLLLAASRCFSLLLAASLSSSAPHTDNPSTVALWRESSFTGFVSSSLLAEPEPGWRFLLNSFCLSLQFLESRPGQAVAPLQVYWTKFLARLLSFYLNISCHKFTETSYYQYNMTPTDKIICTDRIMLKKSLIMTDVSLWTVWFVKKREKCRHNEPKWHIHSVCLIQTSTWLQIHWKSFKGEEANLIFLSLEWLIEY